MVDCIFFEWLCFWGGEKVLPLVLILPWLFGLDNSFFLMGEFQDFPLPTDLWKIMQITRLEGILDNFFKQKSKESVKILQI